MVEGAAAADDEDVLFSEVAGADDDGSAFVEDSDGDGEASSRRDVSVT